MTKVYEKFGCKKLVGALVGIELEVEGENFPRLKASHPSWDMKSDGSLRNGVEFVIKKPCSGQNAKLALEEIASAFKQAETVPSYSFRTSTHIHLNMSNTELAQTQRTVVLYYLAEQIYLNFCEAPRRNNRFCLSLRSAEGVLDHVHHFVKNGNVPRLDSAKYSALNLVPLTSFGTLEFRSLEGTDNWAKIHTWIRALLRLRKAGREMQTKTEDLWTLTNEEIVELLFPTSLQKSQFLYEGWELDMDYQRSLLALIWS